MDWRKARLYGRPTTDHRFESELPDRADRWLRAVERRQQTRLTTLSSSRVFQHPPRLEHSSSGPE
jgi:hypothetical protein